MTLNGALAFLWLLLVAGEEPAAAPPAGEVVTWRPYQGDQT